MQSSSVRTVWMAVASFTLVFQTQAQGTSGSAFYVVPSPLPAAQHGKVIRSLPLATSAALPSAARNLLVLYHSTNVDGKDIAVTGAIAIPKGNPPAGGWPVTTWAHGTTGIGAACAPSKDTSDGPEHHFLGMKEILMDDYVKRGYVVVATDYEGLGTVPGLHPFLQGVSEGHSVLDIVRAARELDPRIGKRYVVVGHSQGGQAELYAASLGTEYLPELTLLGNVAMAPASHIAATLQGMMAASKPSYALGYAMYVLESFASNHPSVDLEKILTPQAISHLEETRQSCITSTVSTGYWATAIPKDQFLPKANLHPVLKVAALNEPNILKISVPTLVVQGTIDDTVLPPWTDTVIHSLCNSGTKLRYSVYPGAGHETVVQQSESEVKNWVNARFSNVAAESNCNALPHAAVPNR